VIDDSGVPYILDQPVIVLGYSGPKHSNLTGGGQAFVGGELWFKSDQELVVSGASGRYPPEDEAQLEDAIGVFRQFGYETTSMGWEVDSAKRYLELPT
jgi:hypothetical protein